MRVLVVEDDVDLADLLRRALRHEPMRHPGQALTRTHLTVADARAVPTELSRQA